MKRLIPLLLLPVFLFASKVLSYNVYDRSDRVDIMLTFDTPYEGALRQSRLQDRIIIKLENAAIESPKVKSISSPFLSKIAITPIDEHTQIIATVAPSVEMEASKTSDAFGLRLRFTRSGATEGADAAATLEEPLSALPTKPEGSYSGSYVAVIIILLIGIVILLWLKSRMSLTAAGTPAKPWPFNLKRSDSEGVNVRFQKLLDAKNRVVMLDYADESYLVVIGNSNLLLDKFHGNRPATEEEFETMLQNKHEELDTFLSLDVQAQGPLQSYKEKASGFDDA